jgi:hypothetical protein
MRRSTILSSRTAIISVASACAATVRGRRGRSEAGQRLAPGCVRFEDLREPAHRPRALQVPAVVFHQTRVVARAYPAPQILSPPVSEGAVFAEIAGARFPSVGRQAQSSSWRIRSRMSDLTAASYSGRA